jgi:hypothetical protein
VTSDVDIFWLWIVLGFDPAMLDIVGFEVDYVDPDGRAGTEILRPLNGPDCSYSEHTYRICVETPAGLLDCRYGHPEGAVLQGPWRDDVVPNGSLVVKVTKDGDHESRPDIQRFWRAGEVHAIGRAVFRIREDAPPGFLEVGNVITEWRDRDHVVPFRIGCGARPLFVADDFYGERYERFDVPAESVTPGRVHVLGDPAFLRGDANLDGKLDLSDAVHTLSALFLGAGPLACEDAADANDDGQLDISDPITILSFLFAGVDAAPLASRIAAADATPDALTCERY